MVMRRLPLPEKDLYWNRMQPEVLSKLVYDVSLVCNVNITWPVSKYSKGRWLNRGLGGIKQFEPSSANKRRRILADNMF